MKENRSRKPAAKSPADRPRGKRQLARPYGGLQKKLLSAKITQKA